MPTNELFGFSVIVNGEYLPEYEVDSEFYVEANLYSPVSFFIEEEDQYGCKQKYPVTPFRVTGSVRNTTSNPCYIRMSVDGQQVFMKPFPAYANRGFTVNGYKCKNEIRELLFSLPRISEDKIMEQKQIPDRNSEIGTIKVECLEAIAVGTFDTWRQEFRDFSNQPGGLSQMPTFNHATKKECGSSMESVGVATREGRSIAQFSTSHTSKKTMVRYNLGKVHLGELRVKYRPRIVLQELGIKNKEWESSKRKHEDKEDKEGKENTSLLETKQQIDIKTEEDTILCREKLEKMDCFSPTKEIDVKNPSKLFFFSPGDKLKCFSPTGSKLSHDTPLNLLQKSIKQEKIFEDVDEKQYRLIEIDDDIQMLEEIDDDVVWMGDQSCCFIEVEDPEVSVVDLCVD